MKRLYLTIGLPRSGKSTWAKGTGLPIVNRDSIRYAIGDSIRYFDEEDKVAKIEKIMVKSLFCAGHGAVIIDATHLKQKYIDAWEEFATNPIWSPYKDQRRSADRNFEIELVKFHTPLSVCQQRARDTFPDDPKFPHIIQTMWENAETIEIPETKEEKPLNQTLGYMRAIKGDL